MKYTLIVDTSFSLSADLKAKYDVEVINLHTYLGNDELYVDINEQQFYDKLFNDEDAEVKTAAPSPATIIDVINKAKEKCDNVIIMPISSGMSSTYQTIKLLAADFENVHVFDTKGVFAKNQILFDFFVENLESDLDIETILVEAEKIRDNIKTYFIVNDLKYLQKNGRIGHASALIGQLLSIKPILEVDQEGYVNNIAKVRSEKKAIDKIISLIKKADLIDKLYVSHLDDEKDFESFNEKFDLDIEFDYSQTIPPVIGVHSGPRILAVSFVDKKGTIYEK